LGLTIARTIIRAHGGEVALLDAEAGGLKVEVRLPSI
jgi:signal transduction histidine kinase